MNLMARTRLVIFRPYQHRAEQCTLGVLVIRPDGAVSAHLGEQLRKARALDPSCNVSDLREGVAAIAAEIHAHPPALNLYETGVGAINVSREEGHFLYSNEDDFFAAVRWTLAAAVEPHRPADNRQPRPVVSRLFIEVKAAFDAYGWLALPGQTLAAHKIIPRFPLSLEEGLTVDFALQNGALNCVQTIDYRSNAEHRKVEANAKLLTLGMAPSFAPAHKAQRFALIAGAGIEIAQPGIKLAERMADDVFIHESSTDMNRLFEKIATAMGQPPMPLLSM